MPVYRRLTAADLPVETKALARALIGCVLVRDDESGRTAGRIVETEAYIPGDPASHAFGGETQRNRSMFLGPFHAYVYLIYGTSLCVNVTSEEAGCGAAVLLRALEPLEGLRLMGARRGTSRMLDFARGPGRLCQAMAIGRTLDGVHMLESGELWLAAGTLKVSLGKSTRIGITKAAHRALRFYERGNPFVSGPRALSP